VRVNVCILRFGYHFLDAANWVLWPVRKIKSGQQQKHKRDRKIRQKSYRFFAKSGTLYPGSGDSVRSEKRTDPDPIQSDTDLAQNGPDGIV